MDKEDKPGILQKSDALSVIGEHWIQKYSLFKAHKHFAWDRPWFRNIKVAYVLHIEVPCHARTIHGTKTPRVGTLQ
jgi:hypothetical protein